MSTATASGTVQHEHDLRRRNVPQADANGKAPGDIAIVDDKKTRKVGLQSRLPYPYVILINKTFRHRSLQYCKFLTSMSS